MLEDSPGIRVLLADDHPVVRAGIYTIFNHVPDIQIIAEAKNGIEAKQLTAQYRPDVLLLDLSMPGPPPIEIINWIREQHPETSVLVFTAHNDDAYLANMWEAGASGYLLKEESPETIVSAVRQASQGEMSFNLEQQNRVNRWHSEVGCRWQSLTTREREVLALVVLGKTDQNIADALRIERKTASNHLSRILRKLGVSSRTEAALWYEREIVSGGATLFEA